MSNLHRMETLHRAFLDKHQWALSPAVVQMDADFIRAFSTLKEKVGAAIASYTCWGNPTAATRSALTDANRELQILDGIVSGLADEISAMGRATRG